jgi:hypothetical protein
MMIPYAYHDVAHRLLDTPGRLECQVWHSRMHKVWRQVHSADRWPLVTFHCRICGRHHTVRRERRGI